MAVWDLFRPLAEAAVQVELFTKIVLLLFSALFAVVAVKAYFKKKTKRMLFMSLAFTLFAVQAVLQVIDALYSPGYFFNPAAQAATQLAVMGLFFFAIFVSREN